mmetsp:Transcript_78290/g.138784  ORF Transcript_78290/g.138784 Transcript_78290/m.138784 type:complete len:82 (+) Transcript_78290:1229-1474(+)
MERCHGVCLNHDATSAYAAALSATRTKVCNEFLGMSSSQVYPSPVRAHCPTHVLTVSQSTFLADCLLRSGTGCGAARGTKS